MRYFDTPSTGAFLLPDRSNPVALPDGRALQHPSRHPLAYLVGLLMPGGTAGSGGPIAAMMFVVFIGLMAAMVIPAFQKVREASQAKGCHNNQRMLAAALHQYHLETGEGPNTWDQVVGPGKYLESMPVCLNAGTYNADFNNEGTYGVTCSIKSHDRAYPPTAQCSTTSKPSTTAADSTPALATSAQSLSNPT